MKIGIAIGIPATTSAMADFGRSWIHLGYTYDGKNILTYINGEIKTIKITLDSRTIPTKLR